MTRALPTVGLARSDRAGRTVLPCATRVNVIVAHHRPLNLGFIAQQGSHLAWSLETLRCAR